MKKILFFLIGMLGIGILSTKSTYADETYTTSTGAVFTRVVHPGFGRAWMDPSGTIWSANQGAHINDDWGVPDENGIIVDSAATQTCKRIGGRLPTAEDYEKLVSYFEHTE